MYSKEFAKYLEPIVFEIEKDLLSRKDVYDPCVYVSVDDNAIARLRLQYSVYLKDSNYKLADGLIKYSPGDVGVDMLNSEIQKYYKQFSRQQKINTICQ